MDFFDYLSYATTQRALIAGTLIALCSSLLGVTLVLRRFSFIGDGLSHVAFGAMSVASVLSLSNRMILVLPATVFVAVVLLCSGKRRIKGDAALAMLSVSSLAAGYLLLNVLKPTTNLSGDVCGTLFGSYAIVTLTSGEVWLSAVLSIIVCVLFVLGYNRLFSITFDENFASATGTKTGAYNIALAVVIAVVVVLAMNLVGSLLVSALVIFPALSAMRLCKSFRSVTIFSVIFSVFDALAGIIVSIIADTPVGATIVALDCFTFATCFLVGKILGR